MDKMSLVCSSSPRALSNPSVLSQQVQPSIISYLVLNTFPAHDNKMYSSGGLLAFQALGTGPPQCCIRSPWPQVERAHCPGGTNVEQPACQPTPPGLAWTFSVTSGHCFVLPLDSAFPPVTSQSILSSQLSHRFPYLHPMSPMMSTFFSRFSPIVD